jgi:hypothetical protein
MRSLIDIGKGYHCGAPNIFLSSPRPSHPVIPHLQSLSFLTQSQIQVLINFIINTLTNNDQSPKSHEWNQPLDFYRDPIY